jgi:hypothetical protein
MGIIDNGAEARNYVDDDYNEYDGRIAIELRGSSSSQYPKPQFRFETQDSEGENLNVELCGLPKENDWILNGPYNDKSLIRNYISYRLSNQMGRYASRTVFCEVILNDEYLGLYLLMEKIKQDNDRIDIAKISVEDNEGDNLTGGYIIKIDKFDGENVGIWYSNSGTPYQYHYPKSDEITQAQRMYIQNYLNEFEYLMGMDNFNDPINGYSQIIDVNSFVDHFILNEFCKNVDAYRLSAYLYKDRESINPKLIAGPIWDFNLTFGDAWFTEEIGFSDGWQIDYSIVHPDDPYRVPFWWRKLGRDEYFVDKVRDRWTALRNTLLSTDSLFSQVDIAIEYISEASERNFERWPEVLTISHREEIVRLKGWILRRLEWIDNNLNKLTHNAAEGNPVKFNGFQLYQNYPNPFNPATTIKYSVPADENINVKLVVFNTLGKEIATLVNQGQGSANNQILWDASNHPSGVYFYQLQAGEFTETKKMLLIK